jgi:Zn-dependent protease with chaperone function
MTHIDARLFDGRSSRAVPVRLTLAGDGVDLDFPGGEAPRERLAPAQLRWHEPLGALRRLELPGGRSCEVPQGPALAAFLAACGHRERTITVWQGSGRRVLVAVMLLLVVAFAGYRWGLPLAARVIAGALPPAAVAAIDDHMLATLDHTGLFAASELPPERQAALRAAIEPLMALGPQQARVQLHFRHAPQIGANAFALPGGVVVVTDALVMLAASPDQVGAVVAHELGHVAHRHGLRHMIQASVLAALVSYWTGDFSTVATAGATLLLNAAYSRDFEREADDYGAALLQRNGQSPVLLAQMLEALTGARAPAEATPAGGSGQATHWSDYLASHPPTAERIERLRRADGH